jgi:hypothetical protein
VADEDSLGMEDFDELLLNITKGGGDRCEHSFTNPRVPKLSSRLV